MRLNFIHPQREIRLSQQHNIRETRWIINKYQALYIVKYAKYRRQECRALCLSHKKWRVNRDVGTYYSNKESWCATADGAVHGVRRQVVWRWTRLQVDALLSEWRCKLNVRAEGFFFFLRLKMKMCDNSLAGWSARPPSCRRPSRLSVCLFKIVWKLI